MRYTRRKTARTTRRKFVRRNRRIPRPVRRNPNFIGGPNTCKVIETLPTQSINLNTPYLISKAGITGTRAPAIAKEFGLYRIAKIMFTFRPIFDTYSSSLAGTGNSPNSVPTLYWKMNRYGDNPPAFTADYLRALGAKANRLDDKQVVVRYKPNTLMVQDNQAPPATAASIKITPWLSTDDTPNDQAFTLSTAEHYGHVMFVEGGGAGTAQGMVCYMDVQVIYEFKNPRVVAAQSSAIAEALQI